MVHSETTNQSEILNHHFLMMCFSDTNNNSLLTYITYLSTQILFWVFTPCSRMGFVSTCQKNILLPSLQSSETTEKPITLCGMKTQRPFLSNAMKTCKLLRLYSWLKYHQHVCASYYRILRLHIQMERHRGRICKLSVLKTRIYK